MSHRISQVGYDAGSKRLLLRMANMKYSIAASKIGLANPRESHAHL
jgi:hypothetical protein